MKLKLFKKYIYKNQTDAKFESNGIFIILFYLKSEDCQ